MHDKQGQDAIQKALLRVCDVFRGVGDARDYVFPMFLLKYISDVERDHLQQTNESLGHGRFLLPKGTDFYALHADRYEKGNGQRIDQAFHAIEESNFELRNVFQGISFNATKLGNDTQKDLVLCQLLEAFTSHELDFSPSRVDMSDTVANAYGFLIKYFAITNGKKGSEFFTPPEVSQLMARLMQPQDGDEISDPCCGSGSLLIACGQLAHQRSGGRHCALYGQEKNSNAWALAKMNMILHGEAHYQIEWADTLRNPRLINANGQLKQFDITVASPPFSLREWGHETAAQDIHGRYWRGVPPRTMGDYAFISHMVETLKPLTGRMAVVVSHGVLFRGAAEGKIRQQLVDENLVDAVIALPAKMFYTTAIPVAILVLRKNKADDTVLFINASRAYQHGKTQNLLRPTDLDLIDNTYRTRKSIKRYAQLVSRSEIAANGYNLNVPHYVDTSEEEDEIDLIAVRAERAQLKAELAALEEKLADYLEQLGYA